MVIINLCLAIGFAKNKIHIYLFFSGQMDLETVEKNSSYTMTHYIIKVRQSILLHT